MNEITIRVQLFGGFRKFGDGVSFTIPSGSTIAAIKAALQIELGGDRLVLDSVLADQSSILRDSTVINNDVELSILPPVCGG